MKKVLVTGGISRALIVAALAGCGIASCALPLGEGETRTLDGHVAKGIECCVGEVRFVPVMGVQNLFLKVIIRSKTTVDFHSIVWWRDGTAITLHPSQLHPSILGNVNYTKKLLPLHI